ncbi:hypothetical protein LCGC14_0833590 [marine sediment metagenome]|uniref:Uncharacterized protein n=1 Tax=marine sediment metagenome TaxID=412755 RepID=A0A0F9Q0F5_9ZZZZ|nr:MAG: hypothetical protein Lokiarch_35310 [Candidatus Lokiarchaeum sp. GC14_75]HEC36955.1 hypothetical protein [bacterium]
MRKKIIFSTIIGIIIISGFSIGITSILINDGNPSGNPNDELYQKSKEGIYVENQFLNATIKIYAEDTDWIHYHFTTWSDSMYFTISTLNWSNGWVTNTKHIKSGNIQSEESSIYVLTIAYRNQDEGSITFFVVVYSNGSYRPYCPLE